MVQVGGDDWASAAAGSESGGDEPLPRLGPTRKWVEVVCCPKCGGLKVAKRDDQSATTLERWQCAYCGHYWKELHGLSVSRCYSVIE